MQKLLFSALFCLLIAVSLFEPRIASPDKNEIQLAQGGAGNAHGCPKGQVFNKAKKSCVSKG